MSLRRRQNPHQHRISASRRVKSSQAPEPMRAPVANAAWAVSVALTLVFPLGAQTLKVTRAVISESEDGPAIAAGASFQPGETVFFSFLVENYRMGLTGKVQLTGHTQAFDPTGTPIVPRDEELIGTTLSDEDKNWKPKLRLPIQ